MPLNSAAALQCYPALDSSNTIYVGRQPIFDATMNVVAYEILFRDSTSNRAAFTDGNQATSQLIINTFLELGLDAIADDKLAFINLTRDFLTGKLPLPFAPGKVVLEILEDISADAEALAGARRLAEAGYTLALDDFILSEHNLDLVPFARIIKVDILPLSAMQLREQAAKLKPFGVQLLAEKVETHEEYALCRELGFELFQGYFFSKPVVMSGRQVVPGKLALLEILAKLQSPDCDLQELERIIALDVGISYKLLRIINSSYYNLSRKVDSIQHALVILGLNTLKSWVTVISLSMVEDKPVELVTLTLCRARLCETLAPQFGCRPDAAFLVGLFSLLDVLLEQPRATLLESLPLADDIVAALLDGSGGLGRLLAFTLAHEQGEWPEDAPVHLTRDLVTNAWLQSLQWTRSVTAQLG